MSEQKIRVGRLRKLAKHLRGNHRVHKKFDFDRLAHGEINKKGNYCGSIGCAMGEFPVVWSSEWRWDNSMSDFLTRFRVLHKSQDANECTNYDIMANFFSITYKQIKHLFVPDSQNIINFGGKKLGTGATAEQVADNIIAFIKKVAS